MRAEAERRGTALLAAPVSGNPKVVKAGRLTMVTSGPEEAHRAALPYLEIMAGGRRDVLRRGRRRPAGQGVPQPDARDRRADAGGDPRARREGRRVAGGPDGVPEQQRDGLDLHPLQDAGLREPRLHADVHPRAPAQGLRSRPRGGARARRADAGGLGRAAGGPGADRQRLHRRRLRRADRAPGQGVRRSSSSPRPRRCPTGWSARRDGRRTRSAPRRPRRTSSATGGCC